jgi:hypothetical protein
MSIFREFFKVKGESLAGIKPKYEPKLPPPMPNKPNCRAHLTNIEIEIADAILIATENLLKDPSEKVVGELHGLHRALRIARIASDNYEREAKANKPMTPFPPSTYTTGII